MLTLISCAGRGMAADGLAPGRSEDGELEPGRSANEYTDDDGPELDGVGLGCLILTMSEGEGSRGDGWACERESTVGWEVVTVRVSGGGEGGRARRELVALI